jgi:alginate O-acetyltransferase complex protein AlgI
MVFSSLFFLFFFLPLNFILYFSFKSLKVRNFILVVFSLIFYAWGEPVWIGLLILSSLIDYGNGLFIEKHKGKSIAKWGLYSTLFFNLGFLLTFKYSDFIIDNLNFILGTAMSKPGFLLPIGISFYTFQTISYTIDVYKGEVKAQRSFLNFLLFVSLFHQLVAGPIVRYSHIDHEIENRRFNWRDFSNGISRFSIGLFKKVCIANIAGELCAQFLEQDILGLTVAGGWFGILMYSIQIYFDFSGYSDMAIGLGWMFGFHYHENFKYPYLASSISDFWRRWHISLSTFFKDYVYIPLGGNKHHQVRNLFIVWGLTGLWHGASWNFVLWGLYFGVLLFLEKIVLAKLLGKLFVGFRHLYALFFIVLGWAIFYFTDIQRLFDFFRLIFGWTGNAWVDFTTSQKITENFWWLIFAVLLCLPVYGGFKYVTRLYIGNQIIRVTMSLILSFTFFICAVFFLVGSTYNPFIYFRF